jgi:hypothetical protein
MQEMQRQAEREKSRKLMTDYDTMLDDRERAYKDKINSMNEKIYSHGMKHTNFLNNEANGCRSEPFHLRNDFDFNRKMAEMKANEKDAIRNNPNHMAERRRMVNYQINALAK